MTSVIRRHSQAFTLVLIVLTLLGHMCELPIEAFVVEHDEASPSAHHGDGQIACDVVLAVPSTAHSQCGPDVAATPQSHPDLQAVPSRPSSIPRREPDVVPRPAPLFLLHAALLI